ncbi:MAG: hypothetical protein ACI9KE_004724 [Polyangiales bacterium]|jgi:hypothetical protein
MAHFLDSLESVKFLFRVTQRTAAFANSMSFFIALTQRFVASAFGWLNPY